MRANIAVFLILAGGVAGCASTPPPPPPMAAVEPAPPPAPMAMGPVNGLYKGSVASTDDSAPRCHKMPVSATARVRNDKFMLGGAHGKIGPDGTVTSIAAHGTNVTGTLANGSLDVTTMRHGCGYHYTLAHS